MATTGTHLRVGRAARGTIAGLALAVNAFFAMSGLIFSCCHGLDLIHNASNPIFWGSVSGMVIAIVSLPPVSRAVRREKSRWLMLPFIAGVLLYFQPAAEMVPEVGRWYLAVLASTALCTVYAIVRILAWPRARTEDDG